jgi:hypothetical protein
MANQTTNLDTISTAQSQKEATANAVMDALSPSSFGGRHASACGGLVWGYYGGNYLSGGALTQIANGTITLGASTVTYIEYDPSGHTISSNTTAFTSGRCPLYKVTTGASTVTNYIDARTYALATI